MLWLSAHLGMMGTAFVIERILDELEPRQSQLIERQRTDATLVVDSDCRCLEALALSVDLAHIDRREGIVPSLVSLIRRCACSRNLEETEWFE
jgi:hypothetical protein